jgi:hypothetical protein
MQPELSDLRTEVERERDKVKFGDPLYVVKEFGTGRVAVMTTDAGGTHTLPEVQGDVTFTDWPSGAGNPGWVAIMEAMQKYLAGGAADENRSVGSTLRAPLDPALFQTASGETRPVQRTTFIADPTKMQPGTIALERKVLGEQPLTATSSGPLFEFTEGRVPGVYLFTFAQFVGENAKPTYAAYAFNIDAAHEAISRGRPPRNSNRTPPRRRSTPRTTVRG